MTCRTSGRGPHVGGTSGNYQNIHIYNNVSGLQCMRKSVTLTWLIFFSTLVSVSISHIGYTQSNRNSPSQTILEDMLSILVCWILFDSSTNEANMLFRGWIEGTSRRKLLQCRKLPLKQKGIPCSSLLTYSEFHRWVNQALRVLAVKHTPRLHPPKLHLARLCSDVTAWSMLCKLT